MPPPAEPASSDARSVAALQRKAQPARGCSSSLSTAPPESPACVRLLRQAVLSDRCRGGTSSTTSSALAPRRPQSVTFPPPTTPRPTKPPGAFPAVARPRDSVRTSPPTRLRAARPQTVPAESVASTASERPGTSNSLVPPSQSLGLAAATHRTDGKTLRANPAPIRLRQVVPRVRAGRVRARFAQSIATSGKVRKRQRSQRAVRSAREALKKREWGPGPYEGATRMELVSHSTLIAPPMLTRQRPAVTRPLNHLFARSVLHEPTRRGPPCEVPDPVPCPRQAEDAPVEPAKAGD